MALMTFGCCIFYMAFAGDLFSALAGTVSSLPAVLKKRAVDLVILGLCPLLPLCLMKNLSALQVQHSSDAICPPAVRSRSDAHVIHTITTFISLEPGEYTTVPQTDCNFFALAQSSPVLHLLKLI